jgi:hypothetical protein
MYENGELTDDEKQKWLGDVDIDDLPEKVEKKESDIARTKKGKSKKKRKTKHPWDKELF